MKAEDANTNQPETFLDRYNDDVDLAYQEYEDAVAIEDNAKRCWKRRIDLAENPPANPTADDQALLEHDIQHFRQRFKERQKSRQKRKKDLDKRLEAREKAKGEIDLSTEKKENWVYRDGENYNIRWSAMPR